MNRLRDAGKGRRRSGVLLGVIAGFIGLGCCVYPVVLALFGAASASAAIGLGNLLYGSWGWAFKLAAIGFAVTALVIQRRRRLRCTTDPRSSNRRAAAWLAGRRWRHTASCDLLTKGLSTLA